ncbi:ABC transporter ATP-binding protein [Pullulanibacillus sp. KACC 23026]|uniref:ABC transporter ATP-binding protein n=1 Tax=Pullulanibacillus sp. KACC 23026 TaxID=3028315 RepID=UPI0023AF23FF|nr:ABC transporter ATP-binding protein [Pullulanibacillus sp. KACC 23026]WEG12026.1 ABC transporter ATP-binding protein [Pullulanibacillus sp. KACC 23026]
MESVLEVNQLSGGYSGKGRILHDLNFQVAKGELVGLVGLNGAGKSTTIKHILGLLLPEKGVIKINGITLKEDVNVYRSHLSYIPETPELYEQLTLREHLEFTAMAHHLDPKQVEERLPILLKQFQMEERLDWFPGHFSKGMKQKVMILCAFLINPSLYIVDEPFVGLDPVGIQAFLDNMVEAKKQGAGILMSTHILTTAEQYCDRFIFLHKGRIVAMGTLKEIQEKIARPDATLHDIYLAMARGELL